MPTGREADGLGSGTAGLDVNLPASKQFRDVYLHANVGYTWLPDVQRTTHVAGSGIWRVAPMFNLMLEGVVVFGESATVSPLEHVTTMRRGSWRRVSPMEFVSHTFSVNPFSFIHCGSMNFVM